MQNHLFSVALAISAFAICLVLSAQSPPNFSVFSLSAPAINFTLQAGWYRGKRMWYYDFGANSAQCNDNPCTAPLHVLINASDGNLIPTQGNIAESVPGNSTYSDLWSLVLHEVPANYVANSVKSYADVMLYYPNPPAVLKGTAAAINGATVNCPVVPRYSVQVGCPAQEDARCQGKCCGKYVEGWWNGMPLPYFDYGPAPAFAIPLFLLSQAPAMPTTTVQPNTGDEVPFLPTLPNPLYSAFWLIHLVTVPSTYQNNSLCDENSIVTSSAFTYVNVHLVVNCPVIAVEDATVCLSPPPSPMPTSTCNPYTPLVSSGQSSVAVTNTTAVQFNFNTCMGNPDLSLSSGVTYTFNLNTPGHPFWIKTIQGVTSANGHTAVINNGNMTGAVIWTPTDTDIGKTYYYDCEYHFLMHGAITVTRNCFPLTYSTPHTFTVQNVSSTHYRIDGCQPNPPLTLTAGVTYSWDVSVIGHGFFIRTVPGIGQTNLVASVNGNGIDFGTITWTPSISDVGGSYSYNCEFHTAMTGTIRVIQGSSSTSCTPEYVQNTSHIFTVVNVLASSWTFDSCATNPTLKLTAGVLYTFRVNSLGHPFWLKTVNGTSALNGITGATGLGTQSGDVVWTPQATDAGQTFYYNFEYHAVMNGKILVVAGASPAVVCTPTYTLTAGSTVDVTNTGLVAFNIGNCTTNPALVVTAGSTYMFNVLSTGHPFWIKSVQGAGQTNGASGVTNNGVQTGIVTFTPTCADAGRTLYYNCEYHPAMTGTITVMRGSCPVVTPETAASTLSANAIIFALAIVAVSAGFKD